MFGEKLLLKKYPYLGYSDNLMEYFSIIGYSETFIPELLSTYNQNKNNTNTNNNNNNNAQSSLKNQNPYPPTVLSSITSKADYGIVDNELIITQLYPENPKIFLSEPNQSEPEKVNVIYSFCFDSSDGKKKLFYTCFGYKFYELYKDLNTGIDYYIPKAFCIISQYPFFNTFYLICKNVYNILITNSNKIPFEILIYNIVNYIPSPINLKLELNLFGNESDSPKIELNQLTGYPNIDFDLYEIFNLLPLNLILEIYVLTFLEQSLLFFSSNLEILNTIMYIMYMFNYPCNDSTYFWHIVSVSKNNLVEENKFVGKIMVSLLGVNATYNESINTFAFGNYHYIVDIDNKKLHFKESLNISFDEREDINKLNQLVSYIETIFREKNVNSKFLKQPLINLKNHLENHLSEKIINFSSNPKKNVVNFYKEEIKNIDISKKIIEFFYDCNLTLLTKFYNDNELNTSFDKIVKEEGNSFNDSISNIKSFCDEEKIFLELFRSTVKYKIYFDNFMEDFDVMEVFKIPFLFSEMFIKLKLKDPNKICCDNFEYFNIIDHLYRLTNNKQIIIKKINFNIFYQHYIEKLSIYFQKFFINEYDNNIFDKNNVTQNMIIINKPKNKLIILNKNIINRYMYLLQNFYEKNEIENLFPHVKVKEDLVIKIIDRRLIYQVIKNRLIEKKYISSLNFLIYSLIYIVCLTIIFHPFDKMIAYLLEIQKSLKLINFFMRDYLYTLIKSIYKYYLINKKTRKFPEMTLTHVKMYFCILANFIRQNFIVPNEEMMVILKSFFSDIIFQERKEINILDEGNKNNISKINENSSNEDIYKNGQYLLFMKYCFNSKGIYKGKTMVDKAMEEYGNCVVIIKNSKKILNPQIFIKIKDYIYKCRFFSPQKLCKDAENLFEDLFDNYNLDFLNLNIQKLREIILNLIQYGTELENKPIPIGFLINTLYILRNFEDYYQSKEKSE